MLSIPTSIAERVLNITDRAQMLHDISVEIQFKNGYGISVIKGQHTYGGPDGYFEIAPLDKQGDLDGSLLDENDRGDDVLGYLTKERVIYYIEKISSLTEQEKLL